MMTEALPLHSTGSIALNKWSKKADSIQIRFRGAVHPSTLVTRLSASPRSVSTSCALGDKELKEL